jgi:tetratricopeptide (TPR) repeat protein
MDVSGQDNKKDAFNKAVEAYSSGNYAEALTLWKDIYNKGYRSAELAYDIGNAYFKLDSLPGAILFYERAYLLDPADEDINYNLQIARSRVTDKIEEIPELFFIKWFNFISLLLNSNRWAVISLATFLLFLLFLSVFLYTSKYRFKVTGFWLAILMIFISALSISFSFRNKTLVHDSGEAIIFSPVVNGKSSPDDSGTNLFVLHQGTKISVEEEVGGWFEIRLSDGNKGWIPANTIKII